MADSTEQYQVLSDIEHLKKRKSVYLGEVSNIKRDMFIYDISSNTLSFKTVSYNTGLLKLFDEIFSNAVDNYQRTKENGIGTRTTSINVEFSKDHISVINNGKSIPIKKQAIPSGEELYIPQIIFTLLRSGSNFDDTGNKRTWGGMNGMGCKIVSFLSSRFEIELLSDKTYYSQLVLSSTEDIRTPIIQNVTTLKQLQKLTSTNRQNLQDYTKITYYPIFSEFELTDTEFTKDFIDVASSRVFEVSYLPLDLYINGVQLPRLSWNNFAEMYGSALSLIKGKNVPICVDRIMHYTSSDSKWNVSFSVLNQEVKTKIPPISFVNYITTQDGGTHINYIVEQLSKYLKSKFSSLKDVRTIKDKLFICLSSIVPNPKFESQAKNRLTTSQKEFSNALIIPQNILKLFSQDTDIVAILEGRLTTKKNRETKSIAIASIEKAKDATFAGTNKKALTRLILTEGDSALTTAVHGVEHIPNGVDYFGMFPLRGKSLNVRVAPQNRYLDNVELRNIKVLLGLTDGKTYTSINELRYGGVILMTDADTDGAHIKSLIINFFESKFPSLLKIKGFIREFITPMIKITMKSSSQLWKQNKRELMQKAYKGSAKDTMVYPLYNRIEFSMFEEQFLRNVAKAGYEIDYIKGLATIEKYDTERYFDRFDNSEIRFAFDENTKESLDLAFSKNREDDRKEWIGSITEDTHLERVPHEDINCSEFINTDLCLFSFDNCVRSIPSLVDGLKPTQRKILAAMLNMGSKAYDKIKVTELGGLVTKNMKYEHGDQSMNETIIGMAQDYTGSNNINLLIPIGQFGTRRQNGKDHGSPRYVHTSLNPIARKIFPEIDDTVYEYKFEEGEKVEPTYFIPIIPLVLANGATGIGTGWSTEIPAFDVNELIILTKKLVECKIDKITALDLPAMYNGYNGKIYYDLPEYIGEIMSKNSLVNIRRTNGKNTHPKWTYEGNYSIERTGEVIKLSVKDASPTISVEDIYATINKLITTENECLLKFVPEKFSTPEFAAEFDATKITEDEIIKMLKINGSISATNMVLFDHEGHIKKYREISEIIDEWYEVRYGCYEKRLEYLISKTENELRMISNKYRFVKEIAIDKTLNINNKSKKWIEDELLRLKYEQFDDSYNYLLSMPIYSLTKEKLKELESKLEDLRTQLEYYKETTPEEVWSMELDELIEAMRKD